MSQAMFYIGDTRDVLATLPDNCVDMVLTSPPFLALRSYLPADHPDKHRELGSEPDPATFIDTLLALTADWDRVLAPHGSICVELGDTYSGSGGSGGDYNEGGLREGQAKWSGSAKKRDSAGVTDGGRLSRNGRDLPHTSKDTYAGSDKRHGWPLAKSMVGIPHLYHLSLAYGRNILTGQPSPAGFWRVRNVVAWCRPNPPVGALGDKFRPATSYLTIATKAKDRWFDLDAVRTPLTAPGKTQPVSDRRRATERGGERETGDVVHQNPGGAPPLDWWNIPTSPYKGQHYATYPPALCERPIASMCPREVCTECGEPRRRIVAQTDAYAESLGSDMFSEAGRDRSTRNRMGRSRPDGRGSARVNSRETETTGWSECDCRAAYRPGVVLDPFGGSGTTGQVASGMGRDSILIDIDERNADLARDRIGMFCTVIDTRPGAAA